MKTAFRPFLVLFCALTVLACSKSKEVLVEEVDGQNRPFADYEVVPGDDPFTFQFNNKSTNFKELEWRFGDDSLSHEESPSHVFLSDGKFEVSLKATAPDGSTARKLYVIEIDASKVIDIVALKTGRKNEVQFTVRSSKTHVASVKWDFGDGNSSEGLSPEKVYEEGKLFTSNAVVTTDKGSVVKVKKLVSSNGTLVEMVDRYLLNVGPAFKASAQVGRWGVVADWRVNDAVKQRGNNMGSWDEWEGNSMSMESWGSEPDIINGKIQQTSLIPLDPGEYYYELKFHDYSSKDLLYSVVSKSNELPDIGNVTTDPNVVGYTKILGSVTNGPPIYTAFKITEAQPLTFGFVATFTQADQNFKLTTIRLYKQDE